MIPVGIQPQVDAIVDLLERVLDDDLVGVYLHGSAVLGCFGPHSDIDLVAVSRRPLGLEERRVLVASLLETSAPYEPSGPPRPVELDLVLVSALHPWRYPTPFELCYGESHRASFEAGDLAPWESSESRDLAAHVTVLRHAGVALHGPSIEEAFPHVPDGDYRHALTHDLEWCRTRFAEKPRYGVLSIARIWATVATGVPHSKATGADWALPRLSPELRPVLAHGRDLYSGAADEELWGTLPVAAYIEAVATEIDSLG